MANKNILFYFIEILCVQNGDSKVSLHDVTEEYISPETLNKFPVILDPLLKYAVFYVLKMYYATQIKTLLYVSSSVCLLCVCNFSLHLNKPF